MPVHTLDSHRRHVSFLRCHIPLSASVILTTIKIPILNSACYLYWTKHFFHIPKFSGSKVLDSSLIKIKQLSICTIGQHFHTIPQVQRLLLTLNPECQVLGLAHSRHSVNIYWINSSNCSRNLFHLPIRKLKSNIHSIHFSVCSFLF